MDINITLTSQQINDINSLNSERTLEQQVTSIFNHGLRDTLYRRDRQRKVNQQNKVDAALLQELERSNPDIVKALRSKLSK